MKRSNMERGLIRDNKEQKKIRNGFKRMDKVNKDTKIKDTKFWKDKKEKALSELNVWLHSGILAETSRGKQKIYRLNRIIQECDDYLWELKENNEQI